MSKQNGRRPGHYPELTPTYVDEAEGKIVPVNKLTLAPGDEEREVTILMRPHIGSDREKDFALLRFVSMLREESQKSGKDDLEIILSKQEEFDKVCADALDMDGDDLLPKYRNLTVFEQYEAFQYAMEYRTGGMREKQVQAALKKLKGEPEKSPQAEAPLPLPELETTV